MFNLKLNFMSYDFKYADLLDDDVFKLVFGRESTKDVMIEFLNQVIPDRKREESSHSTRRGLYTTLRSRFNVRWRPGLTPMTSCRSM